MKKILVLEPYYGGSHKHFLEGLQRHVVADYTFLVLPARKWKMRMQLSALWFVEQIKALPPDQCQFDLVFCSSFIDVAVFRAMVSFIEKWNSTVKILTYFHENQFGYPQQFKDRKQHQFSAINFNSALASDSIAFNTEFNRDNFFAGCRKFLKAASDMQLADQVAILKDKSVILYPGIDFTEIDQAIERYDTKQTVPTIVWNHRWEHDKDPEQFFLALQYLEKKQLDFKLIVLGESFASSPVCFKDAESRFADKILHLGFAESYQDYANLLAQGDIVVSTARHEFYGISIIEAVRAGCLPVLPCDLSYPELFNKKFLYPRDRLAKYLASVVEQHSGDLNYNPKDITEQFSWLVMKEKYAQWFHNHMS